jgi:hypothetical protein
LVRLEVLLLEPLRLPVARVPVLWLLLLLERPPPLAPIRLPLLLVFLVGILNLRQIPASRPRTRGHAMFFRCAAERYGRWTN